MKQVKFSHIRIFLESWSLYPGKISPDTEDGYSEIDESAYNKMRKLAKDRYGNGVFLFLGRIIDATDGQFYISAESWEEVESQWNATVVNRK